MPASDRSLLGIARQTGKGAPVTIDGSFDYLLFTRGALGANSLTIPLDMEIGGAPVLRDVVKVGVHSMGSFEFIPRPHTLGHLLHGVTGRAAAPVEIDASAAFTHAFTLPADGFDAPYFTFRSAPGKLWGEVLEDCRMTALGLQWRGANFVRGQAAFTGLTPNPSSAAPVWNPSPPDQSPPFITPVSTIEIPDGSNVKCLAGSFLATVAIPMDQQWIVGSYSPDDLDIVQKAYVLNLTLKVANADLYNRMVYDGSGVVAAWTAEVMKEASFHIEFQSAESAGSGNHPFSLTIEGNGAAAPGGNVAWSAQPVGLRAGTQVVLNATGVFLADAAQTIQLTLVNEKSTQY